MRVEASESRHSVTRDRLDSRDRWRTTDIGPTSPVASRLASSGRGAAQFFNGFDLCLQTSVVHSATCALCTTEVCRHRSKHSANGAAPHIHQLVAVEVKILAYPLILPTVKQA